MILPHRQPGFDLMIEWQFDLERLRWFDSSLDCPPLDSACDNVDEDQQLHGDGSSFETPHLDSDEDYIEEDD